MKNSTSLANSQHWPCGTPRSQGNAFTAHLVAPAPAKPLTKGERYREYQREYSKARYVPAAERKAKLLAFSKTNSHNFTQSPTASKTVKVASGRFASA